MVDAITSYNANKPKNVKEDLTINWNKLTVKEIKEYESEGQEVPGYIKEWAEYMEKLKNIPDDITYATYVNPSSSINANADNNFMVNGDMISAAPTGGTQTELYRRLCQDTITNLKSITTQLEEIMERAEKEVEAASNSKDGICDRIQTLQQRASKLKSDKKDPLAAMEIIDINNQIKTAGDTGITTIDVRLIALQNVGADIVNANDLMKGGGELVKTALEFARGSSNFRNMREFLGYSNELKNLSKEHKKDIKNAAEQQENNMSTVEEYKGGIATTAGQFIPPAALSENSADNHDPASNNFNENGAAATAKADEKAKEKKEKEAKIYKNSKEEKEKSLANQKILTDPNEILKRKLKRGEI